MLLFFPGRLSGKNENRYSKFKIFLIQIDKLPRTFVQSVTHLHECCQDFITLLFTYSNKKAIKNFIFLCTAVSSGQRRHQVLSRANQISMYWSGPVRFRPDGIFGDRGNVSPQVKIQSNDYHVMKEHDLGV